ncbi:MAG: phosphonoacetaldehyde hydrolase [Bryobacteraceae bacterium]|nr:phosphonoacetaldehyde hydrolase [Bryobacteraceae bacterium]
MKLEVVVLDWAGTTVDYGCQAPIAALRETFARHGIDITPAEARRAMGLPKKEHLREIAAARGMDLDVDALNAEFEPIQLSILESHSDVIPGAPEAAERFRARGLKIGSTTGYTRAMLRVVMRMAEARNFRPDFTVTPEEAGGGRPFPWMAWRNLLELRAGSARQCVKIGDTISDIEEGRNAGMWTIAVARTGNETGLSEIELTAMEGGDREAAITAAKNRLLAAGAHYAVNSVAECDAVLEEIEERLSRGERP